LLVLPNNNNHNDDTTAFKGDFIPYNLKGNKGAADPSTYPISWETDIDEVIDQMRGNQEVCFWLFDNVMECVTGSDAWKRSVRSGYKSPSEITTASSEALFWILLKNHWNEWKRKATTNVAKGGNNDAGSATSALTTDSEESLTLFTKKNKGSTKDGWSDEGLNYFNQLKDKVEADRNSERGKAFERLFKEKMMERASDARANKRKITSCRVDVANDLSDDDDGQEEQRIEEV